MSDVHDDRQHDRTADRGGGPAAPAHPGTMPSAPAYPAGFAGGSQPGYSAGLMPPAQRPLPPHIAAEWRLASVGRRAVGAILDRVVVFLVIMACVFAWIFPLRALALQRIDAEGLGGTAARDLFNTYIGGALAAAAISVVAYLLISTWWLGRTGATPGKAMVGIRVQRFSEPGTLGFGRALLRGVVKIGFALGPVLLEWLPYASVAWDSERLLRGWHDLAADDIVLEHRSWGRPS